MATTTSVFLAALVTAIFTGLGAVPFLFARCVTPWWHCVANGIAAGLMLGATFNLVLEGVRLDPPLLLMGMLTGLILIVLAKRLLRADQPLSIGGLDGASAQKVFLVLGVMTAHSFAEGVGVGVAFGGTGDLGSSITAAIALHNIPEGLAICLVMIPRGTAIWRAALWSIFTSLPQPVMAVPAFLFVTTFAPLLPFGLGLAAGAMIWMVFAELVPDALKSVPGETIGIAVALSMMGLWAFQLLVLGHL